MNLPPFDCIVWVDVLEHIVDVVGAMQIIASLASLYQLVGFHPKQRLGFANRFSRLRDYWPTLLSSSVCISGTYEGLDAF